jgi:hypothetical protein
MKISHSNIVSAFASNTIGTKVTEPEAFHTVLINALRLYTDYGNGQLTVPLPLALPYVSCGIVPRKDLPLSAYVVREHRGEVGLFANRKYVVGKPKSLAAIVYTAAAYKSDPQVTKEEGLRITDEQADFVLVAVLASLGGAQGLSSQRFVRNLAGGNNRYSPDNGYTIDQAIQEAKEVEAYERDWITVAD